MALEQFGDLPLVDRQAIVIPEQPVEIKRFSAEDRAALTKEGYAIYELTGQSIRVLREAGRPFRFN